MSVGRLLEPDATTKRIEKLVEEELERLASDSSGWITLYRDPGTGSLWIHDYPPKRIARRGAAATSTRERRDGPC